MNSAGRIYESNGPDVKIRGTAAHIAEKYTSLARDAQSAGDPVATESYLQYAEHYLRIVAAANAHHASQGLQADGEGSAARGDRRDGEDGGRFNGSVQQPGAEQPRFEAADGDAEPEAAEAVPPSRQRSRRSNGSGEATRQAVDESADGPAVDEPSADGGQEEAAVEAS